METSMANHPDGGLAKTSEPIRRRAEEVANTLEWLFTALILAFVFRAFVMEAFRIPTGSMADTLRGAHFRLRCRQCGYKYRYGLGNFPGVDRDVIPTGGLKPEPTRCPSCGYRQLAGGDMPFANGDRILVFKSIYQFCEPRRWDVIVFKNPLNPAENYIKRLIGRPGEKIEIIDGDIYVNDRISRKPPNVQQELWMPIYNSDYIPVRPEEPFFNGHVWKVPLVNDSRSDWRQDPAHPSAFVLTDSGAREHTLHYDTSRGNGFRAAWAYDDPADYRYLPYCSDLMVRFWSPPVPEGRLGASLSKYGITYRAWVDYSGELVIARVRSGADQILARTACKITGSGRPVKFTFANVDHQLVLRYGRDSLTFDLGLSPDYARKRDTRIEPQVAIFATTDTQIEHIAIYKDIHYTEESPGLRGRARAAEGDPIELGDDQYFVMGDNSPRSEDGRWWSRPGVGNNGKKYREGIVPREYLVGKAMIVYWPAGFRPTGKFPLALVPNLGEMRLVYGGSERTY
jgi:signal peptidase I